MEKKAIDTWLKGSASAGSVPFVEQDWIEMKKLLQKKKRRRILFWWWCSFLAIGLATGGAIFFTKNNGKKHHSPAPAAKLSAPGTTHATPGKTAEIQTDSNLRIKQIPATNTSPSETHGKTGMPSGPGKAHTVQPNTPNTKNNREINNTRPLTVKPVKTRPVAVSKAAAKKNQATPVFTRNRTRTSKTTIAKQKNKRVPGNNDTPLTPNTGDETTITGSMKKDTLVTGTPTPVPGEPKADTGSGNITTVPDTGSANNNTPTPKNDSTTQPPVANRKKPTNTSFFYAGGSFGNNNAFSDQFRPGISLARFQKAGKKWFIAGGTDINSIGPLNRQTHFQVVAKNRIPGSVLTMVYTKTTTIDFKPSIALSPFIGVQYQAGKIPIGAGLQYQQVITNPTVTVKVDSIFAQGADADNYTVNAPYQNSFTGKQSWQLYGSVGYTIRNRYTLGITVRYLLQHNTVTGLEADKPKNFGINFSAGIKFKRKTQP